MPHCEYLWHRHADLLIADSTEDLDYNSTQLFSGGIDPAHLPKIIVDGKCTLQYPHNRLQVNTVFEIIKAAGKQTAYVDKHPAYDIVRGPSGTGLTTGYFPEIASIASVSLMPYDRQPLKGIRITFLPLSLTINCT